MRSTSCTIRSASSQIRSTSGLSSSADIGLQQLCGAADAGQRVLHLVRQGRGEAGDRSGRARGWRDADPAVGRPSRDAAPPGHAPAARQRAEMAVDADRLTARESKLHAIIGDRRCLRTEPAGSAPRMVACGATNSDSVRPASTLPLTPNSCSAAGLANRMRSPSSTAKTALGMLCRSSPGSNGQRAIVTRFRPRPRLSHAACSLMTP